MIFLVIKIILTSVNVIVLFAGAVQGSVAYVNYCDDYSCDFKPEYKFDSDVDFIAVIILSGVGTLFWVSRQCHN